MTSTGSTTPQIHGSLLSVNVGGPREVQWAGRTVRTSIWKYPTEGRVTYRGINLSGDAQADRRVHGGPDKAIYAYAAEDYAWWEAELHCELPPGTFGENLTTTGIDLATAVVGEEWSIGTGRLRVAQPRMPCFKLGIRMGDAAFVQRFDDARRYGIYLRIEREGDLAVGDRIELVSRPAHGLTATYRAELQAAPTREGLERVAHNADVPQEWRMWADRQLRRAAGRDG
jgi:MOSC domain-containing protein YiiM